MPTFLRSLFVRTLSIKYLRVFTQKRPSLTRNNLCALVASLLLCALSVSTNAQSASYNASPELTTPEAVSSSKGLAVRRIVTLRRNEMPEGARFTLMADAPLGDYKAFADGERVCIMIPQAAFISARKDETGRGFADMRIDERDENVMLSFSLQQGATVNVKQNFNRLDVLFMTNERATSGR
ncbi:MAG TPA: hypothetical protein VF766_14605 [Pyrinomonadaceae bacterium]